MSRYPRQRSRLFGKQGHKLGGVVSAYSVSVLCFLRRPQKELARVSDAPLYRGGMCMKVTSTQAPCYTQKCAAL